MWRSCRLIRVSADLIDHEHVDEGVRQPLLSAIQIPAPSNDELRYVFGSASTVITSAASSTVMSGRSAPRLASTAASHPRIALTTTDLGRAGVGYDAVLGVLGYRRTIAADTLLGWGGQQPEILIYPVEGDDMTPHRHGQAGLQHLAFEVPDQAIANVAGTAAVDSGWTLVHPPQVYDYADGYC